jgi:hypothetical protein
MRRDARTGIIAGIAYITPTAAARCAALRTRCARRSAALARSSVAERTLRRARDNRQTEAPLCSAGGAPAAAARVRAPQQRGSANVDTRASAAQRSAPERPRSQQSAALRCKLRLWQTVPLQGRGFTAHSQSVVRSLRFTPVAAKQQEHYDLNMHGQVRRA